MRKFVNLRLPVAVAISLCLGIICVYCRVLQNSATGWIIFSLFALSLLIYLLVGISRKNLIKRLSFILVFLTFFSFGAYNFGNQIDDFEKASLSTVFCHVDGKVTEGWETSSGVCVAIKDVTLSGKVKGNLKYGIYTYVNGCKLGDVDVGDVISFDATLSDRPLFYEDVLSTKYLSDQIKYTTFVDYENVEIKENSPNLFEKFNLFIRQSLRQGLDDDAFSLSYALLTGHDEFVDLDILTRFRSAGIAHVFAVSGLHIGFLATVLAFVFRKLRLNRWVSLVLTTTVLFLYSGVCGFSSSSIRAAIMCTVLLFANNTGFKYDGLSSVGVAAVIVLILRPVELFAVGFQLSFGVVIGLLLLTNPISKLFRFLPEKVARSLGAVISAQLVGIPICLSSFGQFSVVAVLFNLVFIPVVGVIYVVTFACCILGGLFSISTVTLFIPSYVYRAVIWFINVFDYSWVMVGGVALGVSALFYFSAVVVSCGLINLKKSVAIALSCVLFAFTALSITGNTIERAKQTNFYVTGSNSFCASVVTVDGEVTVIVNYASRYCSVSRLNRILAKTSGEIDNLVVANGYGMADVHLIVTKLNGVADVKNVYYYSKDKAPEENAIRKSFKDITIGNFSDLQPLPVKNFDCKFRQGGYAVQVKVGDTDIISFSKFQDNPKYKGIDEKFDYVVAIDYLESIFDLYSKGESISYMVSEQGIDAQTQGNLVYRLKTAS